MSGYKTGNLLTIPDAAEHSDQEFFETIFSGEGNFRIERIISSGHTTPEGMWYDQDRDEWVVVLQGEAGLGYEDGSKVRLSKGDSLFLPRHCRHRVVFTSSPCIWLAVFSKNTVVKK
jgi:cupin 2 domain-containing protein